MARRKKHRKGKPNAAHRRHYSTRTGEGVNIDRLFIRGLIDDETYIRYLREYDRQTRQGQGLVAIGEIRNGKLAYRMTGQADRFYDTYFDSSVLELTSPQSSALVDSVLGKPPDYRRMMLQERKCHTMRDFCNAVYGKSDSGTWDIAGETEDLRLADDDETTLDSYLRKIEENEQ